MSTAQDSQQLKSGLEVPLHVAAGPAQAVGPTITTASAQQPTELVLHQGGCHCGKVTWTVEAPSDLLVLDCNCSICRMKGNLHFIVPAARFVLLSGQSDITEYKFATEQASHKFCKHCGVQSFYTPRSNPDGVGVQVYAIKSKTIRSVSLGGFDGVNWEEFYEKTEQDMKKMSSAT